MLSIKVSDARKEGKGLAAKTTYLISTTVPILSSSTLNNQPQVQTFTIRRRYSEFLKAYGMWKNLYPILPALPPKTTLKRFSDATVQHRLEAFNKILRKALAVPKLREMSEFQEFLGIRHASSRFAIDENEPWHYHDPSFEACMTDQDLDRICDNYRKNKPDLSDVLNGMGNMALKCRHLGQLLKLMEEDSEDERKNLVRWAALRLEDLPIHGDEAAGTHQGEYDNNADSNLHENLSESKASILKYVKYYQEKKWIDAMLDRAVEIVRQRKGLSLSPEDKSNSSNVATMIAIPSTQSKTLTTDANPEPAPSTKDSASIANGSLCEKRSPELEGDICPPMSQTDAEHSTSDSSARTRASMSEYEPPITSNLSNDRLSVQLPPARPRTPPPFRGSISSFPSEIVSMLHSLNDDEMGVGATPGGYIGNSAAAGNTNEDSENPVPTKPVAKSFAQVNFMNLFSSLEMTDDDLEKKTILRNTFSKNPHSRLTCAQLQYVLGSFVTEGYRREALHMIKRVNDPEKFEEIDGYGEEFTSYAREHIKQMIDQEQDVEAYDIGHDSDEVLSA